jgi:hypothetical protein
MTTTAPPPEALATAPNTIVITQFEVLLGDIAEAKAKAADITFDYNTKEGNKAARSYVFAQRKLKSRIESARTDAKSYALAYGRKVDSQAAELKEQVEALIKPHQEALDAITQAEADRVQRHRAVIHSIRDLGRVPFGACAEALAATLEGAKAADINGLEEFTEEAAAALLETIRTLEAAHAKALADEVAAAELEQLREQLREQQRIQQEKDAEEARLKAQQEAIAEAARKAQEEADAAALLAIEEAEQRAADAEARAAAAEARAADAEDVVDLLQSEALLAIKPAEVPEPPAIEISDKAVAGISAVVRGLARSMHTHEASLPAQEEAVFFAANQQARATSDLLRLRDEIAERMRPLGRIGVADALVAGTLHPAITVDWSKV